MSITVRFSPEGDRILFSRADASRTRRSLWSVRADGSDARQLVTGTDSGDWQWLPAGSVMRSGLSGASAVPGIEGSVMRSVPVGRVGRDPDI